MRSGLAPVRLNDGHQLPAIGLGTSEMSGEDGVATVLTGLHNGYRLLDTAVGYGNEAEVGEAVRRCNLPAADVVVSTKIPGRGQGYEAARRSIAQSRQTLGLEQIGLHLIHWPIPQLNTYVDTWKALVAAQADGEIRSIGVSNFTSEHLTRIIDATGVVPAVNQIELHPDFPQTEQRQLHGELGIVTASWSPLGRGRRLLHREEIVAPAARCHVSPAQVVLRWHHQIGAVPIVRSAHPERQKDNLNISNFGLHDDEVWAITNLGRPRGRLWNADPNTVSFM